MAHFNSFFNICSLGSSVNAKKKFWVVSSSSSVCDFFCLQSSVETTICLIFGKNFCTCHKLLSFCIKTIWKAQKNPPKNFYVLLYFNSKTLLKHLPNTFYFSSCQKHVQSNKNNAVGGNIFYYFKRVNDRCIK